MDKLKVTIIIFFTIIALVGGYLFYRAQDVSDKAMKQATESNIDATEKEYKIEMSGVFRELTPMLESGQLEENKLEDIKEKLLKITVPRKDYQDLHMETFLMVNKFIADKDNIDEKEIENAKIEIAKLIEKNIWINSN
jgi:hypothetical protein